MEEHQQVWLEKDNRKLGLRPVSLQHGTFLVGGTKWSPTLRSDVLDHVFFSLGRASAGALIPSRPLGAFLSAVGACSSDIAESLDGRAHPTRGGQSVVDPELHRDRQ